MASRIQQEIRTAKNVFYDRKKRAPERRVDRMMGVLGFYNWGAIPIKIMKRETTTIHTKLRMEVAAIRLFQPTMNTKHNQGYFKHGIKPLKRN